MGSGAHSPPPPAPVPVIPPAASPPTLSSASSVLARGKEQIAATKGAKGMGFNDTIKTNPEGIQPGTSNLATPTLLGK